MERNTRFKDAPWLKEAEIHSVILGGAGGISSWTALFLSRALEKNLLLYVYDFDTIEIQNLGGQFFKNNQLKKPKVEALVENISEYAITNIEPLNEKYESQSLTSKFMIAGFDNMKARKDMFNAWVRDYANEPLALFIDGRLLAEQIQIYCVKSTERDIADYKKFLYNDSEIQDAPCTFKQTTHAAAIMGGLITSFLLNHIANIFSEDSSRAVPFYYEQILPVNYVTN